MSETPLHNTLANELNPYLQQHADNPVAWQVWGDEAFAIAVRLQRPVLLSIGYSSCHWCGVMERESFSDKQIGAFMNDHFVNIKVDREERPDLDDIYQISHQFLTGRPGGWPLTLFLCPKTRLPFIAGTYSPKHPNADVMSFSQLLDRVSVFYQSQSKEFSNLRKQVRRGYDSLSSVLSADDVSLLMTREEQEKLRETALASLLLDADTYHGGFGQSAALQAVSHVRTKFPLPLSLERLLHATGSTHRLSTGAVQHAIFTLSQIALGGLQDHLGGGFFRYAVDAEWQIPHFEKMLYDNAQLLSLFARGASLSNPSVPTQTLFETAAAGIVDWIVTEMLSPEGGFYTSMSADYNGTEGAYYTWDKKLLLIRLSPVEKNLIEGLYRLDGTPNYGGSWHLCQAMMEDDVVEAEGLSRKEGQDFIASAKAHCLSIRRQNKLPERDKKIMCGNNALVISALAEAALVFNHPEYIKLAHEATDFITRNLWRQRRLSAVWYEGESRLMAYLTDYVFLMDAMLQVLQVEWRDSDYQLLLNLAEALIENFEDEGEGGFFFTAHDHEALIYRDKPDVDNVMPSGNGVAAKVLGRLGHLAAEPRYLNSARATVQWAKKNIHMQPQMHHNLLLAHEELVNPQPLVLLSGGESMSVWQRQIRQRYGRHVQCYLIPESSELHPPEAMVLEENQALLCIGGRCLLPQVELAPLLAQIEEALVEKII